MSNASSDPVEPAQKQPAWPTWLALVYAAVVFYGAQFLAIILFSIYGGLRHYSGKQLDQLLNNGVAAQFLFILFTEAVTVGAIYLFIKRHKARISDIGLKKPTWADPFFGLAGLPLYLILYVLTVGVVTHFVPGLNVNQQQDIGFNNVSGTSQMVLTFISLVVLPPIAEEIMVRGFLYTSLKKALKLWQAALVTSLIFASAHLPEGGAAGPLYIAALDTFVLSLVLIYLREKTGSLWASITLHAAKNGIAFVALFVIHAR